MYFGPSLVTTVASFSAANPCALGLRVGLATTAIRTAVGYASSTSRRSNVNVLRSTSCSASKSSRHYCHSNEEGTQAGKGDGDDSSLTCVISAAITFLEAKQRIVGCLSSSEYSAIDSRVGASVGAHMRHTLDHFSKCCSALPLSSLLPSRVDASIVDAVREGNAILEKAIRYDHRIRGGTVETDPNEAAAVISSLLERLRALPRGKEGSMALRRTLVTPTFMLGEGGRGRVGDEHEFESNLERELFFCCHHGTHHDAMIQLILKGLGGETGAAALSEAGKGFGVAPSTTDYRQKEERPGHDGRS